jgi:hypothetical protein
VTWAASDLDHRIEREADDLRHLIRGRSKREQREHLADVGLK